MSMLYTHHKHVNQLTSLLIQHGIKEIVVCPGARNAPLAHNFSISPEFSCYAVTDERSAAFFAMGLSLAAQRPVAICVTSGSALLNTLPAVAEAFYQHIPLLVISADRPSLWIGQQDGQTLPQVGALSSFVNCSVQLPENNGDVDSWACNRLINEALMALRQKGNGPSHINVPLSEPLFVFDEACLPDERRVEYYPSPTLPALPQPILEKIKNAHLPLIITGLLAPMEADLRTLVERGDQEAKYLLIPEITSNLSPAQRAAKLKSSVSDELAAVDLVVYVGGTLINKPLKNFLRQHTADVIRVDERGELTDTLCHTTQLLEMEPTLFFRSLVNEAESLAPKAAVKEMQTLLDGQVIKSFSLDEYKAMTQIAETINHISRPCTLHLANSSAVRFAQDVCDNQCYPIFCNRGVNGIEGSMSTAAGFSAFDARLTFCLIGDLSFFYDANALWNNNLRGNLRVVLFNNGDGGIFHSLKGLKDSPALETYVAAQHTTSAQGIAESYNCRYLHAAAYDDIEALLPTFLGESSVPILFEIDC